VYIHALVRDAERQKMSKTKGNVIDPLEIIDRFGTDATRFTLAAMAAPGTDIAFNESRTEGYRNFANKIWNAARFLFLNQSSATGRKASAFVPAPAESGLGGFRCRTLEDRWILSRFNRVTRDVNAELKDYRFHEAANRIYDFFWTEFCDWYLELLKPRLNPENTAEIEDARTNLVSLFEAALRLLHPIMPFITEEIWHAMYEGQPPGKSISLAPYPQANEQQIDLAAETEMAVMQDLIVSIRNVRAELKVEVKLKLPVEVHAHDAGTRSLIEQNRGAVERLANVEGLKFVETSLARNGGARSTARFDVHVIYERKIDVAAERSRLQKELGQVEKEIESKQRQLGNEQFVSKAPAKVVEDMRQRLQDLEILRHKLQRQLEEVG
jgi:valyl-tRNA synthetase